MVLGAGSHRTFHHLCASFLLPASARCHRAWVLGGSNTYWLHHPTSTRISTRFLLAQEQQQGRRQITSSQIIAKSPSVGSPNKKLLDIMPTNNDTDGGGKIHIVLQRYRSARILIDETRWVSVGPQQNTKNDATEERLASKDDNVDNQQQHCGLLAYVSFATGTTEPTVERAAQTMVNLSLLTTGLWGDGTSEQQSLMDIVGRKNNQQQQQQEEEEGGTTTATKSTTSLILCPQANLISKLRGTSALSYRGQCSKDDGRDLFHLLALHVAALLLEQQCHAKQIPLPPDLTSWKRAWKMRLDELLQQQRNQTMPDVSIPPHDLFRQTRRDQYSAFDDATGLPTHDVKGEELTKSATKKLKKIRDGHAKRHEKWLEQQQQQQPGKGEADTAAATTTTPQAATEARRNEILELLESCTQRLQQEGPCQVVVGSFGKRQGLEMTSDMGPFCHVLQI